MEDDSQKQNLRKQICKKQIREMESLKKRKEKETGLDNMYNVVTGK